jgi:LCP family protein required for cell wall assembly
MQPRPELAEPDATQALELPEIAPPGDPKATRRRRRRKILLISLLVVALLGGIGLAGVGWYLHSVESSIERVEAFTDVPEANRPAKVAKDAQNFLILGSDTRDPENTGGSRSDTIILAHFPADQSSGQLISIPRDTWVHIPRSKDGKHGDTKAKINAAYAWGGIPLTVQTVEEYTGVRIDHVAIVDFSGFKEIVDALGGVEIDVAEGFTSTHSLNPDGRRVFKKGRQEMDGAAALDYARERYAFANGDFTRIQHQQQVIKAILDKAASGSMLTNPGKLNGFLRSTADAVSVDKSLNIFNTAMDLRHLRSGNLTFLTNPTKGTGRVGTESVVFDNPAKAKVLYDAVRRDAVSEILSAAK